MRLTRIYPNGEKIVHHSATAKFAREYSSVEHWQSYNETHRFGCALIKDGVCVYKGIGHTDAELAAHEAAEKAEISTGTKTEINGYANPNDPYFRDCHN